MSHLTTAGNLPHGVLDITMMKQKPLTHSYKADLVNHFPEKFYTFY
jgi:hypothetical protein